MGSPTELALHGIGDLDAADGPPPVFVLVNAANMVLAPTPDSGASPLSVPELGIALQPPHDSDPLPDAGAPSGADDAAAPPEAASHLQHIVAGAVALAEANRDAAIEQAISLETAKCAARVAAIEAAAPTLMHVLAAVPAHARDARQAVAHAESAIHPDAGDADDRFSLPSDSGASSSDDDVTAPVLMPPSAHARLLSGGGGSSAASSVSGASASSVDSAPGSPRYVPFDDEVFPLGLDEDVQAQSVRGFGASSVPVHRRPAGSRFAPARPEDRGAKRFPKLASTYSDVMVFMPSTRYSDTTPNADADDGGDNDDDRDDAQCDDVLDAVEEGGDMDDLAYDDRDDAGADDGTDGPSIGRSRSRAFFAADTVSKPPPSVPKHRLHLRAAASSPSPYAPSLPMAMPGFQALQSKRGNGVTPPKRPSTAFSARSGTVTAPTAAATSTSTSAAVGMPVPGRGAGNQPMLPTPMFGLDKDMAASMQVLHMEELMVQRGEGTDR